MTAFLEYIKTLPIYLFYGLSLVTVLIGDYSAKSWSLEPKISFFIATVLGYLFSGIFFLPALLIKGNLVIAAMTWMILNIIGFLVIGVVLYKETLTTLQIIGLIFGIISIIILNISSN